MKRARGFSLIEVLITLLLTAIGILGIVAMQSRSIQYTQNSVERNTAIMLTNELIEIIRVNPDAVFDQTLPNYPINNHLKTDSLFFKSAGEDFETASAECASPAAASTAQELRDCWVAKVKTKLPEADTVFESDSYICRSSTIGNCDSKGSALEIQLAWSARGEGNCLDEAGTASDICTFSTRVEP
tara:strand:- start:6726 stop:7283 length:558 start_codon:yes stop_codon:yes gene_type:complete